MLLVAGSSHPALAHELGSLLGCPVLEAQFESKKNCDISIQYQGKCGCSVGGMLQGKNVYIVQTGKGNSTYSINEFLMELLLLIKLCKKSQAKRVTAVVPCFPYARQDKQMEKCLEPITAKLIAQMIKAAGAAEIICLDLHSLQIQGFFDIPVEKLSVNASMAKCISQQSQIASNAIIVSPDVGGVCRATSIAEMLNLPVAVIYKERRVANSVSKMLLVGKVEGKVAIIVDDIVDTCGTLVLAGQTLLENGALEVHAMAVHGILSGNAIKRIEDSPICSLMVTNTVPVQEAVESKKIAQISITSLLAEAIHKSFEGYQ